MREKIKVVVILIFALGYLVAEVWLYESSGLSTSDALLLDLPLTVVFFLVFAVVYRIFAGEEASGSQSPKPPET
ncbi:MAG TPA: hypothetical protein VNY24_06150 [Candidatus Acidoferrales bacterium]|jgi:hypothetical protein|nr:hypothetical protein [Candidatus Acidoferrales bacterium]